MRPKSTHVREPWFWLALFVACGREPEGMDAQHAVGDEEPVAVADTSRLRPSAVGDHSDEGLAQGDGAYVEEAPATMSADPAVPSVADSNPAADSPREPAANMDAEPAPTTDVEPEGELASAAGDEEQAEGFLASDPISAYAPRVYLHPSEKALPMAADAFIAHSSLRWSHDACKDHEVRAKGAVSAAGLGRGSYTHQQAYPPVGLCRHHGKVYHCSEYTRPRDGEAGPEGFFLDLDNGLRKGQGTGSPVYVDYQKGGHITYWFFYGYNDSVAKFNHEGDWERVSIRLSRTNRPTHIAYYQHNGYCVYEWSNAPKYKGHPIVYSAKGSHASYSSKGKHFTGAWWDTTASGGKVWQTWLHLLDVRARPWFGFGGAWGEVGEFSTTTGPLGPSAFKGAVPRDWHVGCH